MQVRVQEYPWFTDVEMRNLAKVAEKIGTESGLELSEFIHGIKL